MATTSLQPRSAEAFKENDKAMDLVFFYDDLNVEVSTEYYIYNMDRLLSAVGGSLGLTLGLSAVTAVTSLADAISERLAGK